MFGNVNLWHRTRICCRPSTPFLISHLMSAYADVQELAVDGRTGKKSADHSA
jgi:hypothetical protein